MLQIQSSFSSFFSFCVFPSRFSPYQWLTAFTLFCASATKLMNQKNRRKVRGRERSRREVRGKRKIIVWKQRIRERKGKRKVIGRGNRYAQRLRISSRGCLAGFGTKVVFFIYLSFRDATSEDECVKFETTSWMWVKWDLGKIRLINKNYYGNSTNR